MLTRNVLNAVEGKFVKRAEVIYFPELERWRRGPRKCSHL